AGPDGGHRKAHHSAPLLPEVVARLRQPGDWVDVAGQEITDQDDQRPVVGLEELEVAMAIIVLPEGEEDQAGLVLLDRVLRLAGGIDPGMPAAARIARRRVLVAEIAILGHDPRAELEEPPGYVDIAGLVHGVDGERGGARPASAV